MEKHHKTNHLAKPQRRNRKAENEKHKSRMKITKNKGNKTKDAIDRDEYKDAKKNKKSRTRKPQNKAKFTIVTEMKTIKFIYCRNRKATINA